MTNDIGPVCGPHEDYCSQQGRCLFQERSPIGNKPRDHLLHWTKQQQHNAVPVCDFTVLLLSLLLYDLVICSGGKKLPDLIVSSICRPFQRLFFLSELAASCFSNTLVVGHTHNSSSKRHTSVLPASLALPRPAQNDSPLHLHRMPRQNNAAKGTTHT